MILLRSFPTVLIFAFLHLSCQKSDRPETFERQDSSTFVVVPDTVPKNSIQAGLTLDQIKTHPYRVVLTGLPEYRLITIYKSLPANRARTREKFSSVYYSDETENGYSEIEEHYMPGLDLVRGYELLSAAHFSLKTEKLTFLFENPVIIRSVYFPSFVQDSLYKKPITRDYFLVSVYDSDTNGNGLISSNDLRRIYRFNADGSGKLLLLPPDYSVVRSEYDPKNDVVYIFAKHDHSGDGRIDESEPLQIFWTSLKNPTVAKRLY